MISRNFELTSQTLRNWTLPISTIISDFPEIFAEFRGKRFEILWRGSRDGFAASEFHRRCDWHANTLVVIFKHEREYFRRLHAGEVGIAIVERET
jgi:hypothetical protein